SLEPSPIPNQMMNNGTRAIFGMGNKAATTAMTGDRVRDHNPAATPNPMPNAVPADHPISNRASDADKCCQRTPLTPSCQRVVAIEIGDGKNNVEIVPDEAPACQIAII